LCFGAKRDAVWKARVIEAERKGQRVLGAKETRDAFYTGGLLNHAWMDLHAKTWVSGLSGEASPKALAKRAGVELEVVLARDPVGNTREIVERKAVEVIARKLAEAQRADDPQAQAEDEKVDRERREWERKEELRREVEAIALPALIAAVEKKPTDAAWLAVLDFVLEMNDAADLIVARRGLKGEGTPEDLVREAFEGASVPKRLGILVEAVMGHRPDEELLDALGVDMKKLEAEAKETIKARRQAEKAEAKQKAQAAAPAKAKATMRALPGTCQKCGCTDDAACDPPCSWANAAHTLCTRCA
jgi:hypothetical protein